MTKLCWLTLSGGIGGPEKGQEGGLCSLVVLGWRKVTIEDGLKRHRDIIIRGRGHTEGLVSAEQGRLGSLQTSGRGSRPGRGAPGDGSSSRRRGWDGWKVLKGPEDQLAQGFSRQGLEGVGEGLLQLLSKVDMLG